MKGALGLFWRLVIDATIASASSDPFPTRFEIVPAVSSPIGAAAYAGIPLTHRELSSSVTFITGSDRAGASVAAHAGEHVKKSVLELGGSDPFIVLDSARMDRTLDAAAKGRLSNTGQSCVASKRFTVVSEHLDAFVTGLRDRFAALRPGDPSDPETTFGPLSSVCT